MRSPKNSIAKRIVEIGPKLPYMAKFDAPNLFIASDIKKEGITVEAIAIKNPKV